MAVNFQPPRLLVSTDDRSEFDSGSELIDSWFQKYAVLAMGAGTAKTYVVCAESGEVAGFYSITTGQIGLAESTVRVGKGVGKNAIPVVVLARLAVASKYQGLGLGAGLLQDCAARVVSVSQEVGVRALVTHAKDESAASFYKRFGFEESPVAERQMMILLKNLKVFF